MQRCLSKMRVTQHPLLMGFVGLLAMVLATAAAFAGKPQDNDGVFLGNGYPSGPHFNLNLLGKKDHYMCPPPNYEWTITGYANGDTDPNADDGLDVSSMVVGSACPAGYTCAQGAQVYGNVVFMRRNAEGLLPENSVQIEFQSGQKGPKGATNITELRVADWCSADVDGNPAVVQLPGDPEGYAVYGRITGKPQGDPTFEFTSAALTLVEDEFGNDLMLLGLVNQEGAFVVDDGQLVRVDASSGGKGNKVPKAVDLTSLFTFDGSVCWINDASIALFCGDSESWATNNCAERMDDSGIPSPVCCLASKITPNGDVLLDPTCDLETLDDGYASCQDAAFREEDLSAIPVSSGGTCLENCNSVNDGDGVCEVGETCLESYACPATLTVEDLSSDNPVNDGDGVCETDETCVALPTADETAVCDVVPVCKDFSSNPVWVFNIEAFVNVLFSADNNGAYNVKLRFYPLPLQQ